MSWSRRSRSPRRRAIARPRRTRCWCERSTPPASGPTWCRFGGQWTFACCWMHGGARLTVSLEKRLSRGLTGLVSYTLGEAITDAPDHLSTSGGGAFSETTPAAPAANWPSMAVSHEVFSRLIVLQQEFGRELEEAGGRLKTGIYNPDVSVDAAVDRLKLVEGRNAGCSEDLGRVPKGGGGIRCAGFQ